MTLNKLVIQSQGILTTWCQKVRCAKELHKCWQHFCHICNTLKKICIPFCRNPSCQTQQWHIKLPVEGRREGNWEGGWEWLVKTHIHAVTYIIIHHLSFNERQEEIIISTTQIKFVSQFIRIPHDPPTYWQKFSGTSPNMSILEQTSMANRMVIKPVESQVLASDL